MSVRAVAGSGVWFVLVVLILFGSAGTLAWPQAWVFLALFIALSTALGLWLRRTDPELFEERMKSPVSADQRPRDRVIVLAILAWFVLWLAVMGLDVRFGWSVPVPAWAEALGAVLVVVAFWGWVRVLAANRFASVKVRVQSERGQSVASTGPYALVRHPMYAFSLLLMIGAPLLLNALWGLAGIVVAVPLLAVRALGEEAVLLDGLPGYRSYAETVRFRLLPGIW
ncbi:MAG: isoprenylcysteine carboxylmethyltransferase family protein [Acetobacteraceae bacterium]|nr:isoprenylcysteine carboxylmethyltransferase family protein [Acetobacteraceae bacterium]